MARDGLPRRGVGGVGLLVVTSSGGRWKAPLLGTYGDDVTCKVDKKTTFQANSVDCPNMDRKQEWCHLKPLFLYCKVEMDSNFYA